MTTVTAVTAFRSVEAVCKTSSRSSRLSREAGRKSRGIPAGGDCRKSIQPVPLDFRPTENTLPGGGKALAFHPAQRRVTKFRQGAGCPFQKGRPCWGGNRSCRGQTPHHIRAQMRFDGRQAVKDALLLHESNKGSPLARRKREEGLI